MTEKDGDRKRGTINISRLKEWEEGVGSLNIGGFWPRRDAGNTEQLDLLGDTVIADQLQGVELRVHLLGLLGSEDNPDLDLDTLEVELLGEVKGDEADIAPVVHEQRGLVTSYLDLLEMKESNLRLGWVMALVLAGSNSSEGEVVDVGMTNSTEISMVRSTTNLASLGVLVPTSLGAGLAIGFVVLPTETQGAVATLLEILSLLILGQRFPLRTLRQPGADILLLLELKVVVVITARTATILRLHPLQSLFRSLS